MADALRSALYSIPAEDRETWVQVGMAVHAGLGEAGFELWDAWSRQAESYKASDARAVWRGFKREGGITVATLYHLAREHGWQGEAPVLPEPSPEEKRRRQEQARREAQERATQQRDWDRVAQVASRMIAEAEWERHPYLAAKGFPAENGLVIGNMLVVPMRNWKSNVIQSAQTIAPDGTKRFLAGGRAGEGVFKLGRGDERWYCEGYATALSVRAALQALYRDGNAEVWVCFSAANLAKVAKRGGPISYVIADHDENGTGEKYARKTGLPYWMPPEPGDANDYHQGHGLEALAAALREVLNERRDAARPSDV